MQQKAPQRGDIILCFGSEDTVGGICPLVRDQVWKANTATMCFNLKQHYRSFSRRRTGLRGQCASNDVLVSTLNSTSDPVICPTLEIRSASDNSSRKASLFVIVQKSKDLNYSVILFFPQLLLSLLVCTNQYNTMDTFQKRQPRSLYHYYYHYLYNI